MPYYPPNNGGGSGVSSVNSITGAVSLVAGANTTVTPSGQNVTIASNAGGLPYNNVTGTTQQAAVNNGYIANNAGQVTITLPAVAAVDAIVAVAGAGAGGWTIAQNSGQTIHLESSDTTTGVSGGLTSNTRRDCVELICVTANTDWVVKTVVGNITIT